ncbi:transposase [Microbacterium oxydans]|nr:transposase [Microbacterium oxydans]
MARKNYTDEFRQRAVDLYESTPGSTLKGIAGDLGISRGALKEWVDKFGSGVTVAAASPPGATGRPESQAAKVLRLEADLRPCRPRPASSRRSGTSSVSRRSISPGRRTGEPLPVC